MRFRRRPRIATVPPAARGELLRVLTFPDFDRAQRTGESWGKPESMFFGELRIDVEEDKALRAVQVGMLAKQIVLGLHETANRRMTR